MDAAWWQVRWRLAYWISLLASRVGRLLPTRFCYALANPIADLVFLIAHRHRRNLIDNLARVVGPAEARIAARRTFRNFGRYIVDFYQLPLLGEDALHRRIRFDDYDRLNQLLEANTRGTVFVTLHLGQAELGGSAFSNNLHPVNVIIDPLPFEPLNRFIQGLRTALGMKIIPARGAKFGLVRALARGEALAMMLDAVDEQNAVTVDLFGAPAQVSSAPARIALRRGAPVIPVLVSRARDDATKLVPFVDFDFRFDTTGDEDADVLALTQKLAAAFEPHIRAHADQWFVFKPVWSNAAAEDATRRPAASDAWPKLRRPAASAAGPPPPNAQGASPKEPARHNPGRPAALAAGPQAPIPNESRELWKEWSLALAIRFGGMLPRTIAYACADRAGDVAYRFRHATRDAVLDNMRHVLGPAAPGREVERCAREAFRNVARYYVDFVRAPHLSHADILNKYSRIHGLERLKEPMAAGRGVVVATAHFGNPEAAVQVGSLLGLNILVLAEPLSPVLSEQMKRLRSAFPTRYEEVGYGGVAAAIRHLRAGGCLAITCDRDIQNSGVPLPFFGVPAPMPLGAVELAMRTGAVLLPGYCDRSSGIFEIYFEEPVELVDTGRREEDVLVNAAALIQRAERWIRSDPGQWLPLERIWKPVPAPEEPKTPALTTD